MNFIETLGNRKMYSVQAVLLPSESISSSDPTYIFRGQSTQEVGENAVICTTRGATGTLSSLIRISG